MDGIISEHIVYHQLDQLNKEISSEFKGDVIFINSGMQSPVDNVLREVIEGMRERSELQGGDIKRLVVLLETIGGYLEVVERLVRIMRRNYNEVFFVIPDYAYSAGTVLAMSGDRIYMNYYSVLGPIDPQYQAEGQDGLLPGMGYLAKYEELKRSINNAKNIDEVKAEIIYILKKFDPAKLFHIEQSIEYGVKLITEWLSKYKFKDWKKTRTRGIEVTEEMRRERAENIAKVLGDAQRWCSHGRGISMDELRGDDIKLDIDDFSEDEKKESLIRAYHSLSVDIARKQGWKWFIHSLSHGMRRVL